MPLSMLIRTTALLVMTETKILLKLNSDVWSVSVIEIFYWTIVVASSLCQPALEIHEAEYQLRGLVSSRSMVSTCAWMTYEAVP